MIVELFVGLKIPDTTALTTKQTLESMNLHVKNLQRYDYYAFEIRGDQKQFEKKIASVDVIVNANKNIALFSLQQKGIKVLVKNLDGHSESLLYTLTERLEIKGIVKVTRGVVWVMDCSKEMAVEATTLLLYNPNFQEYQLL